jgi:hypothetical protein
MAPGSYCYVSLVFTPTAAGNLTATLAIMDDAPDSPQTVPVTATGAAAGPLASISPASVHFAAQPPGAKQLKDVLVVSAGTSALHITGVSIDNPVFSPETQSDCDIGSAGGLNPSFYCQVNIKFAPTASGRYTGTLTIADDASDSPQTVPITGTATGIEIQPDRVKFRLVQPGQVTAPKTATVTNWGTVPITISSIDITGLSAAEYMVQSNTCPQILTPAATCAVGIAFAPTVLGTAQAALTITDDDAASPQKAVLLGDGTDVLLSPVVVNFGRLTVSHISPPTSIKITNTGSAELTITSIAVNNFEKTSAFFMNNNGCSSALAAGASCVIQVIFEPDEDGLKVGQLVVTDSDGGSPQTAQLYGTGEF